MATAIWTNTQGGGIWNFSHNWNNSSGVSGASGPSFNSSVANALIADINNNSYVSTIQLISDTTVNSIEITGSKIITIASNSGNSLTFAGTSPSLSKTDSTTISTFSCNVIVSGSLSINVNPGCTIIFTGTFPITSDFLLNISGGGTVIFPQDLVLAANLSVAVNVGSSLIFNGNISGSSAYSFTNNSGTGTVIFAGVNTFLGQLVNNGVLQLGNGGTTGDLSKTYKSIAISPYSSSFVIGIKLDGTLWGWGINNFGQLGDGTTINRAYPVQIGTATTWSTIVCGGSHVVATQTDGSLWTWGSNTNGQLGDGTNINKTSPVAIGSATTWTSIACGLNHSLAIQISSGNNTLWGWGSNSIGQVGDGTLVDRNVPVQIGSSVLWTQISCGSNFTIGLQKLVNSLPGFHDLYTWGDNTYGQLGNGNQTSRSTPTITASSGDNWASIACGCNHAIGTQLGGTLWAWGLNLNGQLGDGTLVNKSTPADVNAGSDWANAKLACGSGHTVAIKSDGSLWTWGLNLNGQLGDGTIVSKSVPTKLGTAVTWASIGCGQNSTITMDISGTVSGFGSFGKTLSFYSKYNTSSISNVTNLKFNKFMGGSSHTVAVCTDGTLWAWGANDSGQLGDGTNVSKITPTQIGLLNTWASVACGLSHTVAIKTDGTLWAWGLNSSGQLGDGTLVSKNIAIQIGVISTWKYIACGDIFTVATLINGTLYAWGDNSNQQLGDNTSTNRLSPTLIGTLYGNIACGQSSTITLRTDGTMWSWGNNSYGQLGDGTLVNKVTPTNIFPPTVVVLPWANISSARDSNNSIATKINGTLWTWGSNSNSQLGDGTSVDKNYPIQIGTSTTWNTVACGYAFYAALQNDGTLWTWGINYYGQLGDGTTTSRSVPTLVNTSNKWSSISCCSGNMFAINKADNTLWAWGNNDNGQLGNGDSTAIAQLLPVQIGTATWAHISCNFLYTSGIQTNGTMWVWGTTSGGLDGNGANNTYQYSPVQVGTLTTWTSVSSGSSVIFGIQSNNSLWVWGTNQYGEAGTGSSSSIYPLPIRVGSSTWKNISICNDFVAAINLDGTLYRWGWDRNNGTKLTTPSQQQPSINTWTDISCGTNFFLATQANIIWGFGDNSTGQLGNGTNINNSSLAVCSMPNTYQWAVLSSGYIHSAAVDAAGSLYTWGSNSMGEIGDGTTVRKVIPTLIPTGTAYKWASVGCGAYHTMAVQTDGTLWAWGYNINGQLGLGDSTNRNVPVQVGTLTTWKYVKGGALHTVALKTDGTLWSWGSNVYGQLGSGQVSGGNSSTDTAIPVQVGTLTTWASIASGQNHVIATQTNGTLWSWGLNASGQVGDGTFVNKVSPTSLALPPSATWVLLAAGQQFSAATDTNGALWTWGSNDGGQLANGDTTKANKNTPAKIVGPASSLFWKYISCGFHSTIGIPADGTLYKTALTSSVAITQLSSNNTWIVASGGLFSTFASRSDYTSWAMGPSASGQLGLNIYSNSQTVSVLSQMGLNLTYWSHIASGVSHTLAIHDDGSLWACGNNINGQLGDSTLVNKQNFFQIGIATTWVNVACGQYYSFAIQSNGSLWVWGDNTYGQLGDGTRVSKSIPTRIGVGTTWKSIACGGMHTLMSNTANSLLVCGNNTSSQLGLITPQFLSPYNLALTSLTNTGTIVLNRSDNIQFNYSITGSLVKNNTNTLSSILSNNCNIIINSGTCNLTTDACIQTSGVYVDKSATVNMTNAYGVLSGIFTKTGLGTLTINTISPNILCYLDNNTINANGGVILMNGTYGGNTVIFSSISATPGTFILVGDNAGTCITVISQYATFQIGNGGTVGSVPNVSNNLSNGGTLSINRSDSYTLRHGISNYTGNFIKNGTGTVTIDYDLFQGGAGTFTVAAGTVILIAASTNTGGTIVNGNLNINDGGSLLYNGNLLINATGVVSYNLTADLSFEINLSGLGTLVKNGTNTMNPFSISQIGGNSTLFNGTVIVNSGLFNVTTPLFNPGSIINNSNSPVTYNFTASNFTLNSAVSGNGNSSIILHLSGISLVTFNGVLSLPGTINCDNSVIINNYCSLNVTSTGYTIGKNGIVTSPLPSKSITINGQATSALLLLSGFTLTGTGTLASLIMQSGSIFAPGNSPGLFTITGNLSIGAGAILQWEISDNNNSSSNRGVLYDAIDVYGSVSIDSAAQLQILAYSNVNFTNSFWKTQQLWNMIQAGGTINNKFSLINLSINGTSMNSARASNGQFYNLLNTTSNNLTLDWLADFGAGGDPHITTVSGEVYTLPNIQRCAVLYDNGELTIETEMKTMPWSFWNKAVGLAVRKSTYMNQTRIKVNNNNIIINNHSLEVLSYTGSTGDMVDYTYTAYDPDSYYCYGKTSIRGSFRAKLLSIKTEKLGTLQIAFVSLDDTTIINDMKLLAHPELLIVHASGALISKDNIKWIDNFSY